MNRMDRTSAFGHWQRELLSDLRQDLQRVSEVDLEAAPHWVARCRSLARDAASCDPEALLRWPSLEDMSVSEVYPDVFASCLRALKQSSRWQDRWRPLSREISFGMPKTLREDDGTSPILIQHAYHLFLHETTTGQSLFDCDIVLELGGGFGSFCRLARNAGFRGLYVIFDLPHIGAVQRYYLKSLGHSEATRDDVLAGNAEGKVWLVTRCHLDVLMDLLARRPGKASCVATWSLSEFPLALRRTLFPRLHDAFRHYLISFQPTWGGVDNTAYFDDFASSRPDTAWHRYDIPGSQYLLL